MNIKISPKVINKAYLPYLTDYTHKIEVFMGGARLR